MALSSVCPAWIPLGEQAKHAKRSPRWIFQRAIFSESDPSKNRSGKMLPNCLVHFLLFSTVFCCSTVFAVFVVCQNIPGIYRLVQSFIQACCVFSIFIGISYLSSFIAHYCAFSLW